MTKGKNRTKKSKGETPKTVKKKNHFNANDLESQLNLLGLELVEIQGDGNCLFRAISDQLNGSSNEHANIRADICNHIDISRDLYQPFMEEDFDKYLNRMRKLGVYGGNLELVAASRLFKVKIAVHQLQQDIWIISDSDENENTIHIAYHSWEHYSSIRSKGATRSGIPKVVINQSHIETQLEQSTDSNTISENERIVIQSTHLSDMDLPRIRKLLKRYRQNVNAVVDEILEYPDGKHKPEISTAAPVNEQPEVSTTDEPHNDILNNQSATLLPVNDADATEADLSLLTDTNLPQDSSLDIPLNNIEDAKDSQVVAKLNNDKEKPSKQKKLTKREKKDLNRKLKREQDKNTKKPIVVDSDVIVITDKIHMINI
ncbi:hypothetical protein BC833DRAFT_626265 [Globomyces pollinis-pini]|nr:hypothetical protein BC833DRAFT_626265 [Globomyces pollinis-pini]